MAVTLCRNGGSRRLPDGQHAWRKGHWERERPNRIHVQPRWTERNNRRELDRGRWNDRDGDGVPNNRDRQPDNPYRR